MALDSAPAMVSIITQFFRLCSVEHNRKNWLFCDTPNGAQASAIVYTMVEMAKATPEEELRDKIAELERRNLDLQMENDLLKKVRELERRGRYL